MGDGWWLGGWRVDGRWLRVYPARGVEEFGVALGAGSFVSARPALCTAFRVPHPLPFRFVRSPPTDPFIREAFRGFLNKHFAEDILRFWKDLGIIKSLPDNDVALPGLAGLMCQDYVRTDRPPHPRYELWLCVTLTHPICRTRSPPPPPWT